MDFKPTLSKAKKQALPALLTLGVFAVGIYLMNKVDVIASNRLIGGAIVSALGFVGLISTSDAVIKGVSTGLMISGAVGAVNGLANASKNDGSSLVGEKVSTLLLESTQLSGAGMGNVNDALTEEMRAIANSPGGGNNASAIGRLVESPYRSQSAFG